MAAALADRDSFIMFALDPTGAGKPSPGWRQTDANLCKVRSSFT